jgi:DNA-directed RNA polymerase specialized sigma24 family protein
VAAPDQPELPAVQAPPGPLGTVSFAAQVAADEAAAPPLSSTATTAATTTVYAHRERLFVAAVQLLDDAQAAQQVVSETLREAIQLLPTLDDPSALTATVDRLLVSLALVRLKALPVTKPAARPLLASSSAAPAVSLSSPLGLGGMAPSSRDNGKLPPPRRLDSQHLDQLDRTAEVLATLPIEPRLAVVLVVMQGRSATEAARLLGTPPETFRFFLSNGRKLLRRALQDDLLSDEEGDLSTGLLAQPGVATGDGEGSPHDLRRNKKAAARA